MKRTLLAAAAVAGFAVVGIAAPAQAAPPPNAAMNAETYWEMQGHGDCTKVELADGVSGYTVPWGSDLTLLVLKAGSGASAHYVITDPVPGMTYSHPSGRDLSHIIYCTDDCEYENPYGS